MAVTYTIRAHQLASIFGVDPYRTAAQTWHQIKGALEEEDVSQKEAVYWGNTFEHLILNRYEEVTERTLEAYQREVSARKMLGLVGHVDALVKGEKRGVDAKNVGARMAHNFGPPGSDEVPDYILFQCHAYLLLTGYQVWDVAALIGGNEMRVYEIPRDIEMDELILDTTADFVRSLQQDKPPAFDFAHGSTAALLKKLYPGTNGQTVQLGQEAALWHDVKKKAEAEKKDLETAIRTAKNQIAAAMGENAVGLLPGAAGGYRRKRIDRASYTVDATSYVDLRYSAKLK